MTKSFEQTLADIPDPSRAVLISCDFCGTFFNHKGRPLRFAVDRREKIRAAMHAQGWRVTPWRGEVCTSPDCIVKLFEHIATKRTPWPPGHMGRGGWDF